MTENGKNKSPQTEYKTLYSQLRLALGLLTANERSLLDFYEVFKNTLKSFNRLPVKEQVDDHFFLACLCNSLRMQRN